MIYTNKNLPALEAVINKIKTKNFSIQTQYKFLKICKIIKDEADTFDEQRKYLIEDFADRDEEGKLIFTKDGGIKIREDRLNECANKIEEINSIQVQFPDIYFSLEELEPLGLTLGELELLEPFIK